MASTYAEELEAMRLDAARFRWIEKYALMLDQVTDPDGLVAVWFDTVDSRPEVGDTLRQVVDFAMKRQQEQAQCPTKI